MQVRSTLFDKRKYFYFNVMLLTCIPEYSMEHVDIKAFQRRALETIISMREEYAKSIIHTTVL